MQLTEQTIAMLATMSMTIPLFGAIYSLTQDRDRIEFQILASFFIASALSEIGVVFELILIDGPVLRVMQSMWVPGSVFVTPLFWLYVWRLTAEENSWPNRVMLHFILPAVFVVVVFVLDALGLSDMAASGRNQSGPRGPVDLLFLVIPLQWAGYLLATSRRLMSYRSRLKDLFASTESREMRWITGVIVLYTVYWLSQILPGVFFAEVGLPGQLKIFEYGLNLLLVGTISLWGLRQRPGISVEKQVAKPVRYARSALDDQMAERIATKLRQAMERDHLYLNPNLNLWILSRHVKVSDTYVSQVLNENIGANFFDFVNGYRIEAAKTRLHESSDKILTIAYDVGFNSRSSFYTAFGKVTGQTPSEFRKNLSVTTGSDEMA